MWAELGGLTEASPRLSMGRRRPEDAGNFGGQVRLSKVRVQIRLHRDPPDIHASIMSYCVKNSPKTYWLKKAIIFFAPNFSVQQFVLNWALLRGSPASVSYQLPDKIQDAPLDLKFR